MRQKNWTLNSKEVVFTCIGNFHQLIQPSSNPESDEDTDVSDEVGGDDQDVSGFTFPETDAPDLSAVLNGLIPE